MGGSAFSDLENPPFTPRMPPDVYRQAKEACHAALRGLFVYVATPIEGPSKTDHGDIDILVAQEKRLFFPKTEADLVPKSTAQLFDEIKLLLRAEFAKVAGPAANLAIRWPASPDDENGTEYEKEKFIQVDVRICPDIDRVCWILFKHAHGDIWNLLGSIIRPFGLTVDETSLWIRIPQVEKFNRRRAKVQLSSDPVEIMHFLGMKVEGFWTEPFESVEALFDYVTTCRLFWVQEARADEAAAASLAPAAEGDGGGDEGGGNRVAGVLGGEEGKKNLKSNDRRRMNQRTVFRRWIDEFVPQLQMEGRFRQPPGGGASCEIDHLRAMVRDEAFAAFLTVEKEYNRRLMDWKLERSADEAKKLIKEFVPQKENQKLEDIHYRSCLVSGMKKIILDNDPSFEAVSPRPEFKNSEGLYDLDIIRDFVVKNQEQVGQIAWEIQLFNSRQAVERKVLKRKAEEQEAAARMTEHRDAAAVTN